MYTALFLVYLFLCFKGILNLICSKLNYQFFPPKWVFFPVSLISLSNQNPRIVNVFLTLYPSNLLPSTIYSFKIFFKPFRFSPTLLPPNHHYFLWNHCSNFCLPHILYPAARIIFARYKSDHITSTFKIMQRLPIAPKELSTHLNLTFKLLCDFPPLILSFSSVAILPLLTTLNSNAMDSVFCRSIFLLSHYLYNLVSLGWNAFTYHGFWLSSSHSSVLTWDNTSNLN